MLNCPLNGVRSVKILKQVVTGSSTLYKLSMVTEIQFDYTTRTYFVIESRKETLEYLTLAPALNVFNLLTKEETK